MSQNLTTFILALAMLLHSPLAFAKDAAGPSSNRTVPRLVTPTPAQMDAFNKEFQLGRKLSGQRKWAEAVKAFEAALKNLPGHTAALTDLGFAAFQAGDFPKARAANERALRLTTIPEQRAPILYNQGRVSEARGDLAAARFEYAQSLALRPNATVEARLKGLGVAAKDDPLDCGVDAFLPFTTPVPESSFCATMVQGLKDKRVTAAEDRVDCDVREEVKLPDGYRVAWLRVTSEDNAVVSNHIVLVRRQGKQLRPITTLSSYDDTGGLSGDWSIEDVKQGTAAGRPYIWIKDRQWTQDYLAYDDIEETTTCSVTLYFTDRNGPLFCFPESVDAMVVRATLNKDGLLSLRLVKGKSTLRKGLLGEHQLPLK